MRAILSRLPLARRLLPAAVLLNLLMLLYYVVIDYQLVLHADSAIMNLLAQEIRESGRWLPRDWYYANGDLWLWATQAPIVALLAFFPNGYALHAAAGALTAALVLLGAWCVGAMLGQSRTARLLVLLVLSGGISANMAENLYGQAAYGVLFYLGCFTAWSGWRLLHARGRARWGWGALLLALTALAVASNPARAAVFYTLPLAAALLALRLAAPAMDRDASRRWPAVPLAPLLAALAAVALAAAALHGHYLRQVGGSVPAPVTWLDFDHMLTNAAGTARGLLSLLGGLPPPGRPVLNPAGAVHAARLLAALVLLAALPWALQRALRAPLRPARLYFAVYLGAGALVNLVVALCTSVPDMAAPEASVRYLAPALLSALILLTGIVVDDALRRTHALALGALLVLGLTGWQAYRVAGGPGYFPADGIAAHVPARRLADYLEQQGLRYGYATFWNANTVNVHSAGRVAIRPVGALAGLPMPVRHLSSDRWYRANAWRGESFLMLSDDERARFDWPRLAALLGSPSRELVYGSARIIVYPYNIAARLPLWDAGAGLPLKVGVDAASAHRIGRLVDGGAALRAEAGQDGHLLYGPRLALSRGDYTVRYTLEIEGAGADFGLVDVAVGGAALPAAIRPLTAAGAQRVELPFRLDKGATDVEFRVLSNGAGAVTVRDVELTLRALR